MYMCVRFKYDFWGIEMLHFYRTDTEVTYHKSLLVLDGKKEKLTPH